MFNNFINKAIMQSEKNSANSNIYRNNCMQEYLFTDDNCKVFYFSLRKDRVNFMSQNKNNRNYGDIVVHNMDSICGSTKHNVIPELFFQEHGGKGKIHVKKHGIFLCKRKHEIYAGASVLHNEIQIGIQSSLTGCTALKVICLNNIVYFTPDERRILSNEVFKHDNTSQFNPYFLLDMSQLSPEVQAIFDKYKLK